MMTDRSAFEVTAGLCSYFVLIGLDALQQTASSCWQPQTEGLKVKNKFSKY